MTPWNKDTKGICESNSGSFKKGSEPWNKGNRRYMEKECKNCGLEFSEKFCKTSKREFCSKACVTQHRFLMKDTAINDYKCDLSQRIRTKQKYKSWRNDIIERDKECQHCASKEKLDAHHIVPVKQIISENKLKTISEVLSCKLMWDRRNGIAYCHSCHSSIEPSIKRVEQFLM